MRQAIRALFVLVLLGLAACSTSTYRPTAETDALRRALVLDALGQIGRPYHFGGTTPDGFDCSGLVQYVYALQGVALPRTTREQFETGDRVKLKHAEPGDLLFYSFGGRGIDHVAMYLGDGQAVHAPSTGKQVIVAPVGNRWWMDRYRDAVRVIR